MTDSREMSEMLAMTPAGPAEALVSVLCVEAAACPPETLETAVRAAAVSGSAPYAGASAAALQALRKLPCAQLRVSPHTSVDVLRGFLAAEEAEKAGTALAKRAGDSLAAAHFFAVRVPASGGAGATAAAAVGEKEEEEDEREETMVPLLPATTLQDVLARGDVLRLFSEAADAPPQDTLVLLYVRESQFGDMDGGDFICIACCTAMIACCVGMCISSAASTAQENKPQQQMYQQQPMQQPQYYPQQQQPPMQAGPGYYDPSQPPPPPLGGQGPWYPPGMPPNQQPYYQGPASPNSYGAPPPPPLQPQPQQGPVNGYYANPANTNYTYSAAPPAATATSPPAARAEPAACSVASPPPAPLHATQTESPHGLPPALYPSSLHGDDDGGDLKKPSGKEATPSGFENPSCKPGGGQAVAQPQFGSQRPPDDAPAWNWSPLQPPSDAAVWSPASPQADDTKK